MKPPAKYKDVSPYTPDEVYRSMQGEQILSEGFIRYRNDVLKPGGLDDEAIDEPGARPLESMSPDDHLVDLRRR
jgi:hypothetical protein